MSLNEEQIANLLQWVARCREDRLDCDHCLQHVAEFAELELSGRALPDALASVRVHLEQCPCCADEYQALLAGLQFLEGEDSCETA